MLLTGRLENGQGQKAEVMKDCSGIISRLQLERLLTDRALLAAMPQRAGKPHLRLLSSCPGLTSTMRLTVLGPTNPLSVSLKPNNESSSGAVSSRAASPQMWARGGEGYFGAGHIILPMLVLVSPDFSDKQCPYFVTWRASRFSPSPRL